MSGEAPAQAPPAAPDWRPERRDRVDDPAIKRSALDRATIAIIKRATRGHTYEVFRVLATSRGVLRRFMLYNGRLMPFGKLDRRYTELAILRSAAICRAEYEWVQHVPIARKAGLSAEQIAAIGAGEEGPLQERDRVVMRAVDELLSEHAIADDTHANLSEFLSPALILELCLVTGHYAGLAGALNTFGVPIEPKMRRRRS